jgi:predicted MFS family arabinose efflux permease
MLAPQGLGTAAGTWFAGRIGDDARLRRFAAAGVLAFAATTTAFADIGPASPHWQIAALLLVAGFGGGVAWVAGTASGYADLEPGEISHAAPLVATVMRLGASFGTAVAAIVLQHELSSGADVGSSTHVVAAYHSAFQWAASAALIAFVAFAALCRTDTRRGSLMRSLLPSRS